MASSSSLSKPRLVYFASRGLAEQIRVILAETATDYDDVGFQSVGGKQPEMLLELKSKGVLMFDQVPLWEEPNGLRLVQSAAIVKHLARTKGLYGKNDHEMALCDALWEYIGDVRLTIMAYNRAPDAKKEEMKKNLLEVDLPKVLARLDKILQENGTGHLVGAQLTYVDLTWWYWLENLEDQKIVDISKHPHLHKFKQAIEARPNIAAYRKNPKRHPIQWFFPRYYMYSPPNNPNAFKSLIAAEYGGIKIEMPESFQMGVENKTPEFLVKNPNGQVPAMDTPDGPLFESNAIAKYITRKGKDKELYGANEYEASSIDQWVEWYRSKIENEMYGWIRPIMTVDYDKEKYETSRAAVKKNLLILENHLQGKEWIVGKRVTLADIILFCSLSRAFQHVLDPEFLKTIPNTSAWAHRCLSQPQFKVVFADFQFAEKEKQPGELAKK